MSSQMECRICFFFEKLFLPSTLNINLILDLELNECLIEIKNEDKCRKLDYPMDLNNPFVISCSFPLNKDKISFGIILLQKEGLKWKKVAKGELNIYKRYLLANKLLIEKYIHLELYMIVSKSTNFNANSNNNIINALLQLGRYL